MNTGMPNRHTARSVLPGKPRRLPEETRRCVVRETLTAMTRLHRLALALYHYEKLGPKGIAEALDVPPREASRLLVEGTERVARALEQQETMADPDPS